VSAEEDAFLRRFPNAARIKVEKHPPPAYPDLGSPPVAPKRTRLAKAALIISRDRSTGVQRSDDDRCKEANFSGADEYWSDATAAVMEQHAFIHMLAIHHLDPALEHIKFVQVELQEALDYAAENDEPWFINVPNKERRVRPRQAAMFLATQPQYEHLVPPSLQAFLGTGASKTAHQIKPRNSRSPTKSTLIKQKMREMNPAELGKLSQKEMAARFGGVRSTNQIAREEVLAESAESRSTKSTIDS
jgi:hypothetical protein